MDSIFIDKNLFAITMKKFRENSNLSQSAAAKLLDIPRNSIINYEKGKYLPEITTLLNICSLYKCSLSELLNIDDASFMNIPQFFNKIDSNDKIMVNKFKEQLNLLTELNLKNLKLNSEIIADKNKLSLKLNKLNTSKKRYDKSLIELNDSKKRYDKLISELEESKKIYDKLINSLTQIQDNYIKETSDIDDTRTYFLNSFSHILENANDLLNKFETNSKNKITTLNDNNFNEEPSKELMPEVNFNETNEIVYLESDEINNFDDGNDEKTVIVKCFDANIAAGNPIGYCEPEIKTIKLKARHPLTKDNADEFYILKVKGNSMNKLVEDGEQILVHSTNYVPNGSIAVVNIVDESECTLKHYYSYDDDNLIILRPDSYDPQYKDLVYNKNEHNIIVQGKYVGNISEFL